MKWLRRTLVFLALLLAVALALPYFVPLNGYIPEVEKDISARLREPVSIKNIRLAVLPLPHVTVDGIAIGKSNDIRIARVVVSPALFSLLQSVRIIRSIEIDSPVLTQRAIEKIPAWVKPAADGAPEEPPRFRIENIRLNDARLNFGRASLGPFDARISLDSRGEPGDISIVTRDGKLKALVKAGESKYLIDAGAKSWTLPLGPALVFDELAINGAATLNDASLSRMSARLYGGTAAGKANINWRKGLRLDGSLDISQVELRHLAPILSPGARVSGRLSAKPVFSASAASAGQLANALRLNTDFVVQNGVLYGVDIQKAATALSKQGTSGGETRFDQLSGHLAMERGSYHFTQLRIASGALFVDGDVSVSAKNELSGRINAQVKALGASVASVPLTVAGTVDAPLLYPTGGTMAGTAVGTAILGPGLGTSLGARVGGWVEGLFGKKEEKKPKK